MSEQPPSPSINPQEASGAARMLVDEQLRHDEASRSAARRAESAQFVAKTILNQGHQRASEIGPFSGPITDILEEQGGQEDIKLANAIHDTRDARQKADIIADEAGRTAADHVGYAREVVHGPNLPSFVDAAVSDAQEAGHTINLARDPETNQPLSATVQATISPTNQEPPRPAA